MSWCKTCPGRSAFLTSPRSFAGRGRREAPGEVPGTALTNARIQVIDLARMWFELSDEERTAINAGTVILDDLFDTLEEPGCREEHYGDVLTAFHTNAIQTNAITVIISGNRPQATLSVEPIRFAAIDGRLPDLDRNHMFLESTRPQ